MSGTSSRPSKRKSQEKEPRKNCNVCSAVSVEEAKGRTVLTFWAPVGVGIQTFKLGNSWLGVSFTPGIPAQKQKGQWFSHAPLHSQFKVSLGYMRLCHKKQKIMQWNKITLETKQGSVRSSLSCSQRCERVSCSLWGLKLTMQKGLALNSVILLPFQCVFVSETGSC